MSSETPIPVDIKLHQNSKKLELVYAQDESYELTCEFLRVLSPSAEVRGHGPGQETLQSGKINVSIKNIVPVGNYAIQLFFSDGHDSGIYSWEYLYDLCLNRDAYWEEYLERLHKAGAHRDPDIQVVRL